MEFILCVYNVFLDIYIYISVSMKELTEQVIEEKERKRERLEVWLLYTSKACLQWCTVYLTCFWSTCIYFKHYGGFYTVV